MSRALRKVSLARVVGTNIVSLYLISLCLGLAFIRRVAHSSLAPMMIIASFVMSMRLEPSFYLIKECMYIYIYINFNIDSKLYVGKFFVLFLTLKD